MTPNFMSLLGGEANLSLSNRGAAARTVGQTLSSVNFVCQPTVRAERPFQLAAPSR